MHNLNAQSLESYQWKNRILIISSPSVSNADYKQQIVEFSNSSDELAERKMLVYEIIEDKFKITNYLSGKNVLEWKKLKDKGLESNQNSDVFKVLLIGLDGGIKLEQNEVLKKEELFRIIDSMPMRIQEQYRKKQ
jgi:hypothetical protein